MNDKKMFAVQQSLPSLPFFFLSLFSFETPLHTKMAEFPLIMRADGTS